MGAQVILFVKHIVLIYQMLGNTSFVFHGSKMHQNLKLNLWIENLFDLKDIIVDFSYKCKLICFSCMQVHDESNKY